MTVRFLLGEGICSRMLICLDLDDTLYLERDYVWSGFQAVEVWLREHGHSLAFAEKAWQLFGEGHRGTIFDEVLAATGHLGPGLVPLLVAAYRSHTPQISLLPDAEEFVRIRRSDALAIITDGPAVAQWNKIEALGLRRHVDTIVVTDEWGREYWKPHVRAFREVMRGRSSSECVYIADNPAKDFDAPRELGWMPSVRVRREGSEHWASETPPDCRECGVLEGIAVGDVTSDAWL